MRRAAAILAAIAAVVLGGLAAGRRCPAAQKKAAEPPAKKQPPRRAPRRKPKHQPPAPRSRAEVEAALAKAPSQPDASKLRTLRVVLVAFKKDHGPDEHDYPLWQKRWKVLLGGAQPGGGDDKQVNLYGPPVGKAEKTLAGAPKVTVETAYGWPTQEQLKNADLVAMFCYGRWNERKLNELDAFLTRGGGFVAIHPAVIADKKLAPRLGELIGLCWQQGYTTYRHGAIDLKITARDDPITVGLPQTIHLVDESYYPMVGDRKRVTVIATCDEVPKELRGKPAAAKKPYEMFWTYRRGKGRVFVCVLGHFTWTFDDPYVRILLLRGMAWSAGESPYRFDPLVLRGAPLRDADTQTQTKTK